MGQAPGAGQARLCCCEDGRCHPVCTPRGVGCLALAGWKRGRALAQAAGQRGLWAKALLPGSASLSPTQGAPAHSPYAGITRRGRVLGVLVKEVSGSLCMPRERSGHVWMLRLALGSRPGEAHTEGCGTWSRAGGRCPGASTRRERRRQCFLPWKHQPGRPQADGSRRPAEPRASIASGRLQRAGAVAEEAGAGAREAGVLLPSGREAVFLLSTTQPARCLWKADQLLDGAGVMGSRALAPPASSSAQRVCARRGCSPRGRPSPVPPICELIPQGAWAAAGAANQVWYSCSRAITKQHGRRIA